MGRFPSVVVSVAMHVPPSSRHEDPSSLETSQRKSVAECRRRSLEKFPVVFAESHIHARDVFAMPNLETRRVLGCLGFTYTVSPINLHAVDADRFLPRPELKCL